MKVLLDHNTPVQLARYLVGHDVKTTRAMRWALLKNGELIKAAEAEAFEVMITGDQNIYHQQNNRLRKIALVVLSNIDRPVVIAHAAIVLEALTRCGDRGYQFLNLPLSRRIRMGR